MIRFAGFALLFGLIFFPRGAEAQTVHLRDAGALDAEVEDQGSTFVLRLDRPLESRRDGEKVDSITLRKDRVLFIEPDSNEEIRKIQGKISGLLYRVGSSRIDERLDAHHALKQYDAGMLFRPLMKGLLHSRPQVRYHCAFKLGELGSQEALSPLVKAALHDRDEGVRDAAFAASMKIGHPALFVPYAKALFASSEPVRLRAAAALGRLGDVRAVEYLVKRYAISGGSSARNSISSMTSQAYVKDFDVEIAQAAQIADPIVGVLNSGAVLDAKVIGIYGTMTVIETRVISQSLEDLTGRSFGPNPEAWKSWWGDEKRKRAEAAKESASDEG